MKLYLGMLQLIAHLDQRIALPARVPASVWQGHLQWDLTCQPKPAIKRRDKNTVALLIIYDLDAKINLREWLAIIWAGEGLDRQGVMHFQRKQIIGNWMIVHWRSQKHVSLFSVTGYSNDVGSTKVADTTFDHCPVLLASSRALTLKKYELESVWLRWTEKKKFHDHTWMYLVFAICGTI